MQGAAAIYAEYAPNPALRAYVRGYGVFASPEAAADRKLSPRSLPSTCSGAFQEGDPLIEHLFPEGHMSLLFNLGPAYGIARGGRTEERREPAQAVGPFMRAAELRLGQRFYLLGVTFKAGASRAAMGAPARELLNRIAALEDLWGGSGRRLAEEILNLPTLGQKVARIEKELLRRLEDAPPPDAALGFVRKRIEAQRGNATVESLAAESGLSRQHLARRFRESLGVGPKFYSRVARFRWLLHRLYTDPRREWLAAALDLGYYDQAHMIAEFKEFTGRTPVEYFSAVSAAQQAASNHDEGAEEKRVA